MISYPMVFISIKLLGESWPNDLLKSSYMSVISLDPCWFLAITTSRYGKGLFAALFSSFSGVPFKVPKFCLEIVCNSA